MTHREIFNYSAFRHKNEIKTPFCFAAVGLAHNHIYLMCKGLIAAGATLKCAFDEDRNNISVFKKVFGEAQIYQSFEEVLNDDEINLIVSAAVPSDRAEIAIKSLESGKHFLVDKAPVISLNQLDKVKTAVGKTGKKYFVYYGESIDSAATLFAYDLVKRGVIGKVERVESASPHVLKRKERPDWFFKRNKVGGILTDLGSHKAHQFLKFTGAKSALIKAATVENTDYPHYPEFDQRGKMCLVTENGQSGEFSVDWDFPENLGTWGDPRVTVYGEKGKIELLSNGVVGQNGPIDIVRVFINGEWFEESVAEKFSLPFFGNVIYDCISGESTANDLETDFKAIEITIKAQEEALK